MKATNFIRSSDTLRDRECIQGFLSHFEDILRLPKVFNVLHKDKIEFVREASNTNFKFHIDYTTKKFSNKSENKTFKIPFKFSSLNEADPIKCFEDFSCFIATKMGKLKPDMKIQKLADFVLEQVYGIKF